MASSASAGLLAMTSPVATADLPASPKLGYVALVNDATTPAVGAALTGGAAANALVWYNGAGWTVIGV